MNNLNDIFFAPAASEGLTYEKVLENVQRYFSENHASTIAEAGEGNTLACGGGSERIDDPVSRQT